MWCEPVVLLFLCLVVVCVAASARLTRGRSRLVLCVLCIGVGVLGWLALRSLSAAQHAERDRRVAHCGSVAEKLDWLATQAVFPKQDGSGIDPESTARVRRDLNVQFVDHHMGELGFCLGWKGQESCEGRLWSAIQSGADPESIARDLRTVAAALEAGTACPGPHHERVMPP